MAKAKPVEKVDENGNVVAAYRSILEASRENYMDRMAISRMCSGMVKSSHSANSFTYRWMKEEPGD